MALRFCVYALVVVFALLEAFAGSSGASGCARSSSADVRVRSALDMVAVVIDPAYALAVDGCLARQEAAASEATAGRISADDATAQVMAVRARCHRVRDAFELIRARHDEARALVERGELERAEQLLEQIRAAWRELQGGTS